MEFKAGTKRNGSMVACVDVETEWNLKGAGDAAHYTAVIVDVETEWNLKVIIQGILGHASFG